jgi:uncharacterized protein YkwD
VNSPQADYFAHESITLVNAARAQARLSHLTENETLGRVALNYSQRMAGENFYGHVDPQGKQVSDRIAVAGYLAQMSAENIARGQSDPATVVAGWLNSPGHRANIMNPDLREIGAGYAFTSMSPYYHYWTHVFATPDASLGRDRNSYPTLVVTQLNQVRQQVGVAPLTLHPALESLARNHLPTLANEKKFRSAVNGVLNEASRAALKAFSQALALTAAGAATPEDVVAQWAKDDGGRQDGALRSPSFYAAGVAYTFVPQDNFRHYWLLVLAG